MCSAWPQKPSNPHLKSRWEQAHFTKSNHLDCLPLQGVLACFSLSSFTPVITNEEESKEQSRDEPGEQLTAFLPSAVHSHGRTQVPTREWAWNNLMQTVALSYSCQSVQDSAMALRNHLATSHGPLLPSSLNLEQSCRVC